MRPVGKEVIDAARSANEALRGDSFAIAHTQACVCAVAPRAARETLLKACSLDR